MKEMKELCKSLAGLYHTTEEVVGAVVAEQIKETQSKHGIGEPETWSRKMIGIFKQGLIQKLNQQGLHAS